MNQMRIAVATTASVEVKAVEEAWKVFSDKLIGKGEETEFLTYNLAGVADRFPLTTQDIMTDLQSRVEDLILQLKRERVESDYYVGLASGFNVIDARGPKRKVFLENWVYVSDGHQGNFGHGGGVTVPLPLGNPVIDRGINLSIALDRYHEQRRLNGSQSPLATLTGGILTEQHSFVVALISAFAPFYNSRVYE